MPTFKSTLDYLYKQLPMYHRIGPAAYKADLGNTQRIMEVLGHPHTHFLTIHIAGTNGKGSVSHSLASVLQQSGYRTGLYTSPHLRDFRERIRINGVMIDKKYVTSFVTKHKEAFEGIHPSFFEWTVGLAFQYFKDSKVDVAIIETGLGGRLDSTAVITPVLSVITNVSLDHQALLGNTVARIAKEKAGIIKPNIPVVIGEQKADSEKVFVRHAKRCKAPLVFASQHFIARNAKHLPGGKLQLDVYHDGKKLLPGLKCDLAGNYQLKNICTVVQCVDILKAFFKISPKDVYKGLGNVSTATGLRGRWQVLQQKPLVICDTAHNEAGMKEVLLQIAKTKFKKLHIVIGMVADKDIDAILKILPKTAQYYFCKPNIPRGLELQTLMIKAGNYGLAGKSYTSVKSALVAAKRSAARNDLILISGSTFVVAEIV